jgi:hypothetical protein
MRKKFGTSSWQLDCEATSILRQRERGVLAPAPHGKDQPTDEFLRSPIAAPWMEQKKCSGVVLQE